MTDAERKSFMTYSASRGPGKRQIKTNAAVLFAPAGNEADDDDDEDFVAEMKRNMSDSDKGGDSTGSSDSSADDDGAGSESGSDDESGDEEVEAKSESESEEEDSEEGGQTVPLCALCLNQRVTVSNEEVIQCDKCGLAVHENCYMVDMNDDSDSTISSTATEPWFCEPCLYGLKSPPYCELCPNRYGAFKKSDIGGGWVHLLCALYTPGITFGDIDHLSAVSWQEIDYKLFGKKPCTICKDPLTARTGLTVSCDAALCKASMHVTCAQRLGLLVDNSEVDSDNNQSRLKPHTSKQKWYFADPDAIDPRFLTCSRHSNPDKASHLKHVCAKFHKQEEERMLVMHRRVLTQREEKKRQRVLMKHKKLFKSLEGVSIAWPEHENKRPRLLNTSWMFLDGFRDKALQGGMTFEGFERTFKKIDGADLPFLPPAFSEEFVRYVEGRERMLPLEQSKLKELEKEGEQLRKQQSALEKELAQVNASPSMRSYSPNRDMRTLQEWFNTVVSLGVKKIRKPTLRRDSSSHKAPRTPKTPIGKASTSSAPRSRSKTMPVKKNGRVSIVGLVSPKADEPRTPTVNNTQLERLQPPMCKICSKCTDQHMLVLCDICKNSYHLGCLDPPLSKMPKKNRHCGWECSICADSSDDDEEQQELQESESDEGFSVKKLRDRTGMNEKKKEEQKAQQFAYRSAMASHRRPPVKRRRSSAVTGGNSSKINKVGIMNALSIEISDNEEELSPQPNITPAPHPQSPSASPVVKRHRTAPSAIPQRLNGSLLKINGLRRNTHEPVKSETSSRRASLPTVKKSDTLPPTFKLSNGLLAMVSPR